jgi:hypothetical protein
LVEGKELSAKSEHSHDTVAHRTIDHDDGPGHLDIITTA